MLRAAKLLSVNPCDGRRIAEYEPMEAEEVGDILRRAREAFVRWRDTPVSTRAKPMRALAERLRAGLDGHARLMAAEMGKPIVQGREEIEKCAAAAAYFAERAEEPLQPEIVRTEAARSYVAFEPLGVILAIMPWNFPYWQVFRFAVPALMAGNAAVVKHASSVTGCALAIERLFAEAGFPENLVRVLRIGSHEVDRVIENPIVRAVTLTGSGAAGKAVAAKAGSLIKKTVLELGGSDPYVILEDADLPSAVEVAADARLVNAGQSCVAAKRFIVVEPRLDEFERLLVDAMASRRMGDPLDLATQVGPLARLDLRDALERQVNESLRLGARLLLGGQVPALPGAWYPPTVLTSVSRGMPAYDEELFGPVAAIVPARNEREAIRIANDTAFGLGAAVFTRDLTRGEMIAARELDSGNCFVNARVVSDPRLPFGGVKDSGYGRELSAYGLKEFVNIKTVVVNGPSRSAAGPSPGPTPGRSSE
jgi:succinate-semialdehyde dehydrogenase / glutarate-semialdehyde dehydrogenase